MSEQGVLGVVLAHGAMAAGMVDAVRRIAGDAADGLVAISNDGASPSELKRRLESAVGGQTCVVFVDLPSGSCGATALASAMDVPERCVLCGVNLPVLLDFVFNRGLPLQELLPRLVEKGRGSIQAMASG